jgi:hypothetical protein
VVSRKVDLRRLESVYRTLGDLAAEEHPELDGKTRDALGLVRDRIDQIIQRKEAGR